MRKQIVKRHADSVRHRHLDVPRQARVVQFHVGRGGLSREARKVIVRDGAFEFAEQDAVDEITEVPDDRGFPECGETDAVVQSPLRRVDCQSTRMSIYYIFFHDGISKKRMDQKDWVGGGEVTERTWGKTLPAIDVGQ